MAVDTSMVMEQSPAARSSKAPSDSPSEFSSWRDDASSSMATSHGDRAITVNTQRVRMGAHLRGKLEDMIRQRFENYLRINETLQNDTGKLAALECELRVPGGEDIAPGRASISCNEDGTFLVYVVPDASAALTSGDSTSIHSGEDCFQGNPDATGVDAGQLARRWVNHVCEYGMSGRCHSLTALFHFGYTTWKQMVGDSRAIPRLKRLSATEGIQTPGHIAEEEEKPREDVKEEPAPAVPVEEPQVVEPPESEPPASVETAAPRRKQDHPCTELWDAAWPATANRLLQSALLAADGGDEQQALELCTEGLALIRRRRAQRNRGASGSASSDGYPPMPTSPSASSSTAQPAAASSRDGPPVAVAASPSDEALSVVWQLLLLRVGVQARSRKYEAALKDAEELIALQPTCAEGYYWQSVALQGMGLGHEALESLMTALEYEPQNSIFSHAFTVLFEEISAEPAGEGHRPRRRARPAAAAGGTTASVLHRRSRGAAGDALSTTTQATDLSSRSTTPTEVSEQPSRSSSNDSLYVVGAAYEDVT